LVGIVVAVLAAALYWPPAQALVHFGPLHVDDLSACLGAGIVLIGLLELAKRTLLECRSDA
jgi:Ca2+-transporting ATPase